MPTKRSNALPVQCKAIAATGERCKAKPHKKGLCFFHSDPARAAELGRKGGLGNRHVYENNVKEIPAPQTALRCTQKAFRDHVEVQRMLEGRSRRESVGIRQ